MRKNNIARKGLRKFFYSTFEVRGLNLDRLINTLGKKGVGLIDIKKYSNKRLRVTVNSADNEKFFAITEELCYNVKKTGDGGKFYPFLYLYRNIGLLIGALFFIVSLIFVNDIIFSFSFTGSGRIYAREIKEYLNGKGITEYTRFSDIDLKSLGDEILSDNPHLSFVDCRKSGNRLEINSALSDDPVKTLDGDVKELRTDASGVVEKIKVYRGTAVVSEGQEVAAGDLLVDGYAMVKEERVEINVIASVTVIAEFEYEYRSADENAGDIALLYAEQAVGEKEILNSSVIKESDEGEYVFKVKISYRKVFFAG